MVVEPKEFGELLATLREHTRESKERHEELKEIIKVERTERESIEKRVQNIETIFKFFKWLAPVGLILWPIFIPLLQRLLLNMLGVNQENIADLLTFISIHFSS